MTWRILSEPSNSGGLGGTGPEVITQMPAFASTFTNCCGSALLSARRVLSPLVFDTPRAVSTLGHLKSASRSKTRDPVLARLIARLITVVVFPSLANVEVTNIRFGGRPAEERTNEVLSRR